MKTTKKTLAALTIAAALAVTLAGCSSDTPQTATVTPAPSVVAASPAPVETEPAPEATQEAVLAPDEPVADEYSQIVNGQLFQGTESAPVRIGTDVPGAAPAAEAGFVRDDTWKSYAESNDKYVVSVMQGTDGGWFWKVFGLSQHGSFRELDNSGYQSGNYFPDRETAATGPFTVDGRALDRSEFILVVN